ncbi:CDP-diacylglycerol synthase [Pseudoloma neurophilia]|uniref:Phosphatidate cytidylyltransferase n=1 Tax=Pseudoloma neurophilia TaxID=146866 RepID=A0A0R0M164_9MICR|nr:CDP-diacylglycerol synthase [Pseudoloma neurophilia]
MTILMLSALISAMKYKFVLFLSVFLIKIIAYHEVTHITRNGHKKRSSTILSWYLLILSDLLLWKNKIIQFFRIMNILEFTHDRSNLILFTLYVMAIVIFVLTLRKGTLKNQSVSFVLAHIGILMINCPSYCILRNIETGKFWFLFPVLLVVSNDVFAYIVGKLMGKTPLIKISPNKTVEGFIGGFIFTAITGFICAFLKIHTGILDSGDNKTYLLETTSSIRFPIIYLHTMVFIFFSSFCAPFGGLLASTFKRIFRMKDFATYLPGHGGITDRIDCQLLMGIFTHFYISSFVYVQKSPANIVFKRLIKKYTTRELLDLTIRLAEHLLNR